MDWYPLWNSLRIALISCAAVFFLGIFAAYYIAKLPRVLKGVLDVVLTLPMVLPPTVVGYFLLLLFGAKRPLGIFFMEHFGVKLVMNWYSAIFASIVVAFPLMGFPTPGSSGGCGCLAAVRAFWPVRCWPLPVRWANMVPPA